MKALTGGMDLMITSEDGEDRFTITLLPMTGSALAVTTTVWD